jgi:hypothetical protein
MEHRHAVAVVLTRMHNIRADPMKTGLYAATVFILVLGGAARAAEPAQTQQSAPQGDLLSGTPEEQAACSPDATKFCSDAIPDTFRVLACLQDHREKLRKACQKVLEDHGQ